MQENYVFCWPPAGLRKAIATKSAHAVKCAFRNLRFLHDCRRHVYSVWEGFSGFFPIFLHQLRYSLMASLNAHSSVSMEFPWKVMRSLILETLPWKSPSFSSKKKSDVTFVFHGFYATSSLSLRLGRNFGLFLAGILMVFPVRGFRPSVSGRRRTIKAPKPGSLTSFPSLRLVVMLSIRVLRASLDSALVRPEISEIELIRAFLFVDLGETDDFFIVYDSFCVID